MMLSDYEMISILIRIATFVVFVYINIDNEKNQPPKQR